MFLNVLLKNIGVIMEHSETLTRFTNKEFLLKKQEEQTDFSSTVHENYTSEIELAKLSYETPVKLIPENRIEISTLAASPNYCWAGKFFLCRIIAPVLKSLSVQAVVDDPEGKHAVLLNLYNYVSDDFPLSLDKILPVGAVLAIKNPWFKKSPNNRSFTVREDDPKNVVSIPEQMFRVMFPGLEFEGIVQQELQPNILIASADEWKASGKANFAAKRYIEAIHAFSKVLKIEPKNVEILANRAISCYNLGFFHRALEDADSILAIKPNDEKGIYRKAKSLCGLQRYGAAIQYLSDIFSSNPELKTNEVDILLENLIALEKQQKTGEYDLEKLFKNSTKYHDDLADFVGPVEIVEIEGKGRGLVATKDILAGELLYAGKAFAIVFLDNSYVTENAAAMLKASLIEKIVQKLRIEPETGLEFNKLYAGAHLTFNANLDDSVMQRDRIEGIVAFNYFGGSLNPVETSQQPEIETGGIWILPSYINNSCSDSNCIQDMFGEFMTIRAIRDIPKGSEITIAYIGAEPSYKIRTEMFEKYEFVCNCSICAFERAEPDSIRENREALLDVARLSKWNAKKLFKIINELENMRISNPEFNFDLLTPLGHILVDLLNAEEFEEAIAVLMKARSIVFETYYAKLDLEYTLGLCVINNRLDNRAETLKWIKISLAKAKICYGFEKIIKILNEEAFSIMLELGFEF